MDSATLARHLKLEKLHHEGGFFRRTYTAPHSAGERPRATMIQYLVTPEEFSAFHLLQADEIFGFHAGDAVEMFQITASGDLSRIVLGTRFDRGEVPQVIVPGGVWQATRLLDGGNWALLGCTVVPGFEYTDYRVPSRPELTKLFPQHASLIEELTR